jgi:alpha-L-fucosidase
VTYSGFQSVERLVHDLADRVSKNGHLLLNVGPRADGTIPEGAQECLRGIGRWLEVNGEAIYGAVPWFRAEEGPTKTEGAGHFSEAGARRYTAQDIRFTTKDDAIYAICLGRPCDSVRIESVPKYLYREEIGSVSMLGVEGELPWRMEPGALFVDVPRKMPCEHAVTLRITRRKARS